MMVLTTLNTFAGSKLFIGFSMLAMNYGSRYVVGDITKYHEAVLNHPVTKKIVLFLMCFAYTHDIMTSLILTFTITVFLEFLFNEKSRFSIIPWSIKKQFLDIKI